MSTHNICFLGKVRKILCGYPLLSGVMASGKHFSCFSIKTYVVGTLYSLGAAN